MRAALLLDEQNQLMWNRLEVSITSVFFAQNVFPGSQQIFSAAPGRGNLRGRRIMHDMEVTRPEAVKTSKKGSTGPMLQLKTNYFRIQRKKEWGLYQYHVDFAPEIDVTGVRKSLLRAHRSQFNGFLFDGSMLWTTTRLENDPSTITTQRNDGSPVIITIKFTKEVIMTESA